ncbi:uncharacterized protein LOC119592240 [Penaeus monodon]|uniref:uncharacterized protein LOC119592240 n=1 Tax=Penaeus monodon TaxID=6687 RepID=UPI0018A7CA60|nr:uncharacterized protein LOC119592240 [Penaeus monodon]
MTVATVTAATTGITTTAVTSSAAAAILSGVRTAVGTSGANTGRTTLTLQELQVRTSGSNQGTVVSVAGLTQAQLQTAKLSSQSSTQKGLTGVSRSLTPAQLQYLKQQAHARHALALQQQGKVVTTGDQSIKRVQIAGQAGTTQKVQVAVSGGTLAGMTAIQVSQAGRTQLVKPGTVVAGASGVVTTGKAVTRTVTDREVAAFLKQQQLNKSGQVTQVQVPSAQLLAGLQVQGGASGGGTPVATLVKTVSAPSTLVHTPTSVTLPASAINVTLPQARVTTAATVAKANTTQQTVRNIPLPQQLLAKQRSLVGVKGAVGLQLGGKAVGGTGLSTVQIVQGGSQKQMSHVTVQQIQQVFKQVPQTIQHITQGGTVSGTVVGKAVAGGSVSGTNVTASGAQGITTSHSTKLVPMTVASHQHQPQPIKQTIQVVSAGSSVVGGNSGIRVSAGERSSPSALALQAGKMTNPAILSQVSAALQGQPMSVAVRTPTQSPVRIQTSALQTQQTTQTQQGQQQTQQQGQQPGGSQ